MLLSLVSQFLKPCGILLVRLLVSKQTPRFFLTKLLYFHIIMYLFFSTFSCSNVMKINMKIYFILFFLKRWRKFKMGLTSNFSAKLNNLLFFWAWIYIVIERTLWILGTNIVIFLTSDGKALNFESTRLSIRSQIIDYMHLSRDQIWFNSGILMISHTSHSQIYSGLNSKMSNAAKIVKPL